MDATNRRNVPFEEIEKGRISVNNIRLLVESGKFALLRVDFSTKYAKLNVLSHNGKVTLICRPTKHSKNLNEDVDADQSTILHLPEFSGWSVVLFNQPTKYYARIMLYDGPEGNLI